MSHHLLVGFRSRTIVRRNGGFGKSRYRRRMRLLAAAAALLMLAGCGGKHPATVAGCLDNAGFLVTADGAQVNGTSPSGVAFTLTTFPTAAAANRAAMRFDRTKIVVVARALVDFRGNPDPAARLSTGEIRTIRGCLEKANGS
jgi:hypothetical protein